MALRHPRGRLRTTAVAIALSASALVASQAIASGAGDAQASAPAPSLSSAAVHQAAFVAPPTGDTAVSDLGATSGWKVLTSATATQGGPAISTPGFSTPGWLPVDD